MHPNPPEDDALALPPGHIVNHYRIIRVIGRGGFGITYAAEDIHTSTELAIKELLPSTIATRSTNYSVVAQSTSLQGDFRWAIESFIKEAQTLTKFNHPNLVRMLEFFEQNGTAYMVMPYIQGDDLKTRIKKSGALTEAQAQSLFQPLLSALSTIHQAGILHRDIKPENIILQEPNNHPILLDFGASRNLVSAKSQAMTSIISPGYAPIEQYSTDAQYQGPWSDIYALASVLYFGLTGAAPPESPERSNAVRHGRADPCTPLHLIKHCRVSAPFSATISHGMQLSERDRPQSITAWQAHNLPPAQPQTILPPVQPAQPIRQSAASAPATPTPTPPSSLYPPQAPHRKKKKPIAILLTIGALILSLISLGGFIGFEHYNKKKKTTRSTASSTGSPSGSPSGSSTVATVHGDTPSSGSGPIPSPPKPTITTEQIRRFVSDYYAAGESGKQLGYYANYVDYFGRKSCSLDDIETDGIAYRKRWPHRSYTPESAVQVQAYGTDRFNTTTRLAYTVNNSVEFRKGVVKSEITIRPINGTPKIIAVSNSILKSATVTYDSNAQEKSAKQFISRFILSGNSSQGSILNQLNYFAKSVAPYYDSSSANQAYIRNDLLKYSQKYPHREYKIIEALRVKNAGTNRVTIFATVYYITKGPSTRSGNIFNTYEITYQSGQPAITSVTSEPLEP